MSGQALDNEAKAKVKVKGKRTSKTKRKGSARSRATGKGKEKAGMLLADTVVPEQKKEVITVNVLNARFPIIAEAAHDLGYKTVEDESLDADIFWFDGSVSFLGHCTASPHAPACVPCTPCNVDGAELPFTGQRTHTCGN